MLEPATALARMLMGILVMAEGVMPASDEIQFSGTRKTAPSFGLSQIDVTVYKKGEFDVRRAQGEDALVGVVSFSKSGMSFACNTLLVVAVGDPIPLGQRVYRVTALEQNPKPIARKKDSPLHPPGVPSPPAVGMVRQDSIRLRLDPSPRVQLSPKSIVLSSGPGLVAFFFEDKPIADDGSVKGTHLRLVLEGVRTDASGRAVATVAWQVASMSFGTKLTGLEPGFPVSRVEVARNSVFELPRAGRVKVTAIVPPVQDDPAWLVMEVLRRTESVEH